MQIFYEGVLEVYSVKSYWKLFRGTVRYSFVNGQERKFYQKTEVYEPVNRNTIL